MSSSLRQEITHWLRVISASHPLWIRWHHQQPPCLLTVSGHATMDCWANFRVDEYQSALEEDQRVTPIREFFVPKSHCVSAPPPEGFFQRSCCNSIIEESKKHLLLFTKFIEGVWRARNLKKNAFSLLLFFPAHHWQLGISYTTQSMHNDTPRTYERVEPP